MSAPRVPMGAEPPPQPPKFVPVLSPKPGRPVRAVVLSCDWVGVNVHWFDGRNRPCQLAPGQECPYCVLGSVPRWKGYLAILIASRGRQALAELTGECLASCPALRADRGQFRGRQLTLRRTAASPRSAVHAELTVGAVQGPLPPPTDIAEALMRLWFGVPRGSLNGHPLYTVDIPESGRVGP